MLSLVLCSALTPPLPVVSSKIVAASLFKNGYAVLTREIDLPAGGEALIEDIPQGSLGTVWVTTTGGLKLASVKSTEIQSSTSEPAATMQELLALNIGKEFKLQLFGDKTVEGTLVSASADLVMLKKGDTTTAFPTNQIYSVSLVGGKTNAAKLATHRALEIKVEGSKAGRLYMIGLEKGLTWSPAYSIDISDPKKLEFTARAVLLNDIGELSDIEARLVTGFPNVSALAIVDPLLANNTVEEYVRSLGISDATRDAESNGRQLAQMAANAAPAPQDGFGGAGEAMAITSPGGIEEGDLFFYRQPHVTMSKGDRSYYILANSKLDYKEIYTWDSADSVSADATFEYYQPNRPVAPEEVWHSLQFKNGTGQPLTTGPATTYKGGELLGQDLLKYTSSNGEALVRITKALDIRVESADEESERKRAALQIPGVGPFDLVTLKTTLKVANTKAETVHLKISRPFTGELVDAGEAKVSKNIKGLRSINPTGKLVWERDLAPGKTATVAFSVKVYIRTGNLGG